jgi:hypothetical protein
LLAACGMLFSLYIYLFYRTDKTVINQIAISLYSFQDYASLKSSVAQQYPMPNLVVYSLPEAFWVFFITLTSVNFYLSIGKYKLPLIYFPILFAVVLEFLQLYHITHGSFDFRDIWLSAIFWLIAIMLSSANSKKYDIRSLNATLGRFLFVFSYAIVYLAHVNT